MTTEVFTERAFVGGGFSSEPLQLHYDFSSNRSYRNLLCTEWDVEGVYEAIELLAALKKEFEIEIPESDAKYLFSVDKVVDYILEKKDT